MAASLSAKRGIAISQVEKDAQSNIDDDDDDDLTPFRTVQEKVDSWKDEADGLELGLFRIDPPKPMGQVITVHLSLKYKGLNADLPMQLTEDDRSSRLSSVLHSMSRILQLPGPLWSRDQHEFSGYTDLFDRLRENSCIMFYSNTGTLLWIPVFCRTVEEADEVWQRFNSGELEKEMREQLSGFYLPFGPVETTVKVYDYEECKRNFRFCGYRLLYLLYPHINRRRFYY